LIPLLQPSCTEKEIEAVTAVLKSGWWGMGPKCDEFEKRLADRYGRKHCVTVNSCTAALHLALLSHGIGPGDDVIVPALTFISSALAVTYCGANVIFADVNADTLCINWADARRRMSGRNVKAIVAVDYAGYPATHAAPFYPIIQDAAHSCGGAAYGHDVCLSFHPVKNLATGDGGAILTDDDERAERMRALRWVGIDRSTWERSQKKYGWDYDIVEVGYKCHWNDIQAAIALAQLDRLDAMNARRREIAERYMEGLSGVVKNPPDHKDHTWHLYPIRVAAKYRDGLIDYLLLQGISAGVHYKPLTYYPMYAQATPPVTEQEWRKLVSLPIFYDLTLEDQDRVIKAVRDYMEKGAGDDLRGEDEIAPFGKRRPNIISTMAK
jgi:perosamine synthetase